MAQIRVLVVSDDDGVGATLCRDVGRDPALRLVGPAVPAAGASRAASTSRPDVVLLDDGVERGTWVGVCRRLRSQDPETTVLVLSSLDDEDTVRAVILAGAAGFVLRDLRHLQVSRAVCAVSEGWSLLDPTAEARVRAQLSDRSSRRAHVASLTSPQWRLLGLLSAGLTDRQIAVRLARPEADVVREVAAVLRRLGVRARAQVTTTTAVRL